MENIPLRHINSTQKETDFLRSFRIRDIREVLNGKEMVQELHRHDFFFILALKKGSGTHEIDFTRYKICDHSFFIMRPGQVHQLTLKSKSTGYLLEFRPDFYVHDKISTQFIRKASNVNYLKFNSVKIKKIFQVLNYIFHEYTDQQSGYEEVIKSNLGILFVELIRQNNDKSIKKEKLYSQERLEELVEHIERHVSEYKQASQYASLMSLSLFQLNSITKETLGKTCSEIINDYIILESKRYLLSTSSQVSQIAFDLGYEDVSYFIRFFKKHTGHSPEAFRQHFR